MRGISSFSSGYNSVVLRVPTCVHTLARVGERGISERLPRKAGYGRGDPHTLARELIAGCRVVPVDAVTVKLAMNIAEKYAVSHWDTLIVMPVAYRALWPRTTNCLRHSSNNAILRV